MPLTYAPLWRLLAARGMNKTDLAETAGLSSRTVAKLAKDETVTTDTLARLCAVLRCPLGDVAEYVPAEYASLRDALRAARPTERTDETELYEVDFGGTRRRIYVTRARASKATRIECRESGDIVWVQQYPNGISPAIEERVLLRAQDALRAGGAPLVVISGRPGVIIGLDEGVFRSVHAPRADGVCVMSEAAFKCAFSAQTEKAAGGCKEG